MNSEELLKAKKVARRLLGVLFMPGDRVRALMSYPHQYTKGKIYTVKEVSSYEAYTELDDAHSSTNAWSISCFELVGDDE